MHNPRQRRRDVHLWNVRWATVHWIMMAQVSIEQAMTIARQELSARNWRTAEVICRQVLAANPGHAEAMFLLGGLAMQSGKLEVAAELMRRAVGQDPENAEFQYNLGVCLIRTGRAPEAAGAFASAARIKPDYLAARANLAGVLVAMERFEEGIEACRQLLAIAPDHPDAWNNLGVALQKVGRIDEAIVAFERSVAVRPSSVETLGNLGNNLAKAKRFDEAIDAHRRAVGLRPNVAELLNDLGCAYYDAGRYVEAIDTFRRAMQIRPNYPQAQTTLAISMHRAGRLDDAIEQGREAIRQWKDGALPKFNLGVMLLLKGEFEEGWRLHESRLDVVDMGLRKEMPGKPVWAGEPLSGGSTSLTTGKRILLYGEQGHGDFIQFARYIPMVRERGGRIVLGAAPEMVRVARRIEGVDDVLSSADEKVEFDLHCPLLSLPGLFKTDLSTIPPPLAYRAEPELASKWKGRVPDDPKILKIGLCWAGRPTHGDDRNRSMCLEQLAPLAGVSGTWFCSLQKGDAAQQAKSPPPGVTITDFTDELNDFADTAGLIENLDLVISVDTAVVHLAGTMGKPTWVLLPGVPDWRWLLDRSDSPWYPSVRLFRQMQGQDWSAPVGQVVEALRDEASRRG